MAGSVYNHSATGNHLAINLPRKNFFGTGNAERVSEEWQVFSAWSLGNKVDVSVSGESKA